MYINYTAKKPDHRIQPPQVVIIAEKEFGENAYVNGPKVTLHFMSDGTIQWVSLGNDDH